MYNRANYFRQVNISDLKIGVQGIAHQLPVVDPSSSEYSSYGFDETTGWRIEGDGYLRINFQSFESDSKQVGSFILDLVRHPNISRSTMKSRVLNQVRKQAKILKLPRGRYVLIILLTLLLSKNLYLRI